MNLSELRWKVQQLTGIVNSDTTPPEYYNEIINDVYLDLCDAEDWPFRNVRDSFTTNQGDNEYAVPGNVERVRGVVYESDSGPITLDPVSPLYIDALISGTDSDYYDEPVFYAMPDTDTLYLAPTPDDSYTIAVRGWRNITALSSDTDEPVFAERYHQVITYRAAALILDERGQPDASQAMDSRGSRFLHRMRRDLLLSHDDTPMLMGGRSVGGGSVRPYGSHSLGWRGRVFPGRR